MNITADIGRQTRHPDVPLVEVELIEGMDAMIPCPRCGNERLAIVFHPFMGDIIGRTPDLNLYGECPSCDDVTAALIITGAEIRL